MNINYTYSIINVDKDTKTMEIVYESPDYGVLHVGARLPWPDETLEDIVKMYNPILYWLEQTREPADVEEGISGSQSIEVFDPNDPPTPPTLEQLREAAFLSRMDFMLALESAGI